MDQEFAAERPNRAPTHPGAHLREIVMPALAMTVTQAAMHLHVTRQQLHRVLSEKSDISPEMAIRLGKFCGNGPNIWLRMQHAHSLWNAEQKLGDAVDQIPNMSSNPIPA